MDVLKPLLVGMIAVAPTIASGQATPRPNAPAPRATAEAAPTDDEEGEIVVQGAKQAGAVIGDIPPQVQLSPADIRSYGVSSVADLLNELAPQTTSGRGRGGEMPVVLLNGRRISGFAEIRDLPTEAILRVDILAEEVALKYGYSANQRVVNFVLRPRFRALTGELGGGTSTEGGRESGSANADLARIRGDQRVNIDLRYQQSASLLESQRDLTSSASGALAGNVTSAAGQIAPLSALAGTPVTIAGVPASAATRTPTLGDFAATANRANTTDQSPYRTLLPASRTFNANAVLARPLTDKINATLNGSLELTSSDSRRGLPAAALILPGGAPFSPFASDVMLSRLLATDPLRQHTEGGTGHLGLGANRDLGRWRFNFTGNYDHGESRTETQTGLDTTTLRARLAARDATLNPFGPLAGLLGPTLTDRARSLTDTGNVQLVANGPVLNVPAGTLNTTIRVGGATSSLDAHAVRGGLVQDNDLTRRSGNAQINFDLPIASRRTGTLSALGNFSLNANAELQQLSDFGTLRSYGYGFSWNPDARLTIVGSFTDEQAAPSVQQVGGPLVLTPGVRVFDYARGQTVDVLQISGGNAGLRSDDRRVMQLSANYKPFTKTDLTLNATFVKSRTRDAIESLPEPTSDIEAAFPDRFVRDATGQLISIDSRATNFSRESREQFRWGFNYTRPLKSHIQKLFEAYRAQRDAAVKAGQPAPPPPPGLIPPGGAAGFGGGGGPPGGGAGGPPPGGGFGARGPGGGGPGGGGGRPGGGFGGGGNQNGGGRLNFAVYHTWHFRDDVLIRPGLPVLDLLDGDAVGAGGGQPRHEVEVQAGYANNGIGLRLSANWQSGTEVRGGPSGDLDFSPFTTTSLRLFADLAQIPQLRGRKWARGMRITVSANNLLDRRQEVRDASGVTPLRYQGAYLDAVGRTVRVTVRKLLF